MELKQIQSLLFEEYQKNGYHSMWTDGFKNDSKYQKFFNLSETGLIHTEISEAQEEIRKSGELTDAYFTELADTIIRCLNIFSRNGANAEFYILQKNQKNLNREKLHGKVI